MKIKICGLRRDEDVYYVNLCKPDYIGFVFAGEKRRIDHATAKRLRALLDDTIDAVGVFINEDMDNIIRLVSDAVIQVIQLHGDENEKYIEELKSRLVESGYNDVKLIKAVRVKNSGQVKEAENLPVDYLLLDAFSPDEYGGSGKAFNHELIPEIHKPYMLAGGIDYRNVTQILDTISNKNVALPFCVDVSSSVETDGYKDENKIKKMVAMVRTM